MPGGKANAKDFADDPPTHSILGIKVIGWWAVKAAEDCAHSGTLARAGYADWIGGLKDQRIGK